MVTGAAKGIGAAIASAFANEGAQIALLDLDARGVESAAASLSGEAVR
jgi:NAD(P)-dependent dehydrogenase (short-subunit alcohol dehydrogenase family)